MAEGRDQNISEELSERFARVEDNVRTALWRLANISSDWQHAPQDKSLKEKFWVTVNASADERAASVKVYPLLENPSDDEMENICGAIEKLSELVGSYGKQGALVIDLPGFFYHDSLPEVETFFGQIRAMSRAIELDVS